MDGWSNEEAEEEEDLIHGWKEGRRYLPGTGEMEELAGAGGDDEGHVSVTENGELTRLLHQPHAALAEGHLTARRVLDAFDLYLAAPHSVLSLARSLARARRLCMSLSLYS